MRKTDRVALDPGWAQTCAKQSAPQKPHTIYLVSACSPRLNNLLLAHLKHCFSGEAFQTRAGASVPGSPATGWASQCPQHMHLSTTSQLHKACHRGSIRSDRSRASQAQPRPSGQSAEVNVGPGWLRPAQVPMRGTHSSSVVLRPGHHCPCPCPFWMVAQAEAVPRDPAAPPPPSAGWRLAQAALDMVRVQNLVSPGPWVKAQDGPPQAGSGRWLPHHPHPASRK